jgi:hypothetical protein
MAEFSMAEVIRGLVREKGKGKIIINGLLGVLVAEWRLQTCLYLIH